MPLSMQKPIGVRLWGGISNTMPVLVKMRDDESRTYDHRIKAASVCTTQNGHILAYSTWADCDGNHCGHSLACQRTYYRTIDMGDCKVNKLYPRVYTPVDSAPSAADCPFEIFSAEPVKQVLNVYCVQHSRTFLAVLPDERCSLQIFSSVKELDKVQLQHCITMNMGQMGKQPKPNPNNVLNERLVKYIVHVDIVTTTSEMCTATATFGDHQATLKVTIMRPKQYSRKNHYPQYPQYQREEHPQQDLQYQHHPPQYQRKRQRSVVDDIESQQNPYLKFPQHIQFVYLPQLLPHQPQQLVPPDSAFSPPPVYTANPFYMIYAPQQPIYAAQQPIYAAQSPQQPDYAAYAAQSPQQPPPPPGLPPGMMSY